MFGINSKTFVCFLIVLILTLFSGVGGLVLGSNARNLLPASWLSYFPKIGTENVLPVEFDIKPIQTVYLTVSGTIKSITADKITIEEGGESISLEMDKSLKPLKMKATITPIAVGTTEGFPVPPELMDLKDVKTGSQALITARVTKSGFLANSLIVFD